ncbi:MAG: cation diffusion facilitator family transporter [Prevotella sp.]|nr:cation diffusion facilitator family transporter [Prevotella sp.]
MTRRKTLLYTSWISTVGNTLLSAVKIVTGLLAGSLAVMGDGIDSATDVIISLVMLYTARIMNRPPNLKYAFGYDKAESIATKMLSLVIFYAGMQMCVSSLASIFSDETKFMPGAWAIYVTVISIVVKLGLALYQYRQGRKVNSSMLVANAKNMRNDVIISSGVLVGLGFTFGLGIPILDSITGMLISLFIIRSSVGIFIDSNVELMDGVKDTTVYNRIFDAVEQVPGVCNPHRVRSRQIGNMYMIALDIEVDGDMPLNQAHDLAEQVENSIKSRVENVYDIVVHVEPQGKYHSAEKFGLDKETIR